MKIKSQITLPYISFKTILSYISKTYLNYSSTPKYPELLVPNAKKFSFI